MTEVLLKQQTNFCCVHLHHWQQLTFGYVLIEGCWRRLSGSNIRKICAIYLL